MRETPSLKALASKVLERLELNKSRNKHETKSLQFVSQPLSCETKNVGLWKPILFHTSTVCDDYEERIAIAKYDGCQSPQQAQRIAYESILIETLNANPPDDREEAGEDWLRERLAFAQRTLLSHNIHQSQ